MIFKQIAQGIPISFTVGCQCDPIKGELCPSHKAISKILEEKIPLVDISAFQHWKWVYSTIKGPTVGDRLIKDKVACTQEECDCCENK